MSDYLVAMLRGHLASQYLALLLALDNACDTMEFEPGERVATVEETRRRMVSVFGRGGCVLGAYCGSDLVGFLELDRGCHRRRCHVASLVVGVLPGHQRRGVASDLWATVLQVLPGSGIQRIVLSVEKENKPAVKLYVKWGFEVDGWFGNSVHVGADYRDEYSMSYFPVGGRNG